MKKRGLFFIFCFFIGILSVSAKEVNFYFYPNGGSVKTANFSVGEYGYLSYNGSYYASYKSTDSIKIINSISGVTFTLEKSGTSLVSGREWYFTYDGKIYYLSQSKTYSVSTILKTIEAMDETHSSIDLYANWNNKKKTGGTDILVSGSKANSISISSSNDIVKEGNSVRLSVSFKPSDAKKEKIAWSSSNKKVATVSSSGKVTGIKEGKVTITAKSASGLKDTIKITVISKNAATHYVYIQYNVNGGRLNSGHGDEIILNGNQIKCWGSLNCTKVVNTNSLPSYGLRNANNVNFINLVKDGYYLDSSSAWNTKANGKGKSYSQEKEYKASDFCNASKKNCTITLYANWKKDKKTYKIALIGNSKTKYGNSNYPKNKVAEVFRSIVTSSGKSAQVTDIVKGGSTLIYKAQNSPYKDNIKKGSFDYVVLQERTSVAQGDGAKFSKGAKAIKSIIKNKNAKYYVRTSWPVNNKAFDTNVAHMNANAENAARAIGGSTIYDAKAFQAAKKAGIVVHLPDNNHPTAEGAYLAAACIYKNIFQEKASSITYYYGIKTATAKKLLSIADSYC